LTSTFEMRKPARKSEAEGPKGKAKNGKLPGEKKGSTCPRATLGESSKTKRNELKEYSKARLRTRGNRQVMALKILVKEMKGGKRKKSHAQNGSAGLRLRKDPDERAAVVQ